MTSLVSIFNNALITLGSSTVISPDDPYPATVLKARYEGIRDAELRRRRWRFSMARAALAKDAIAPAFDYGSRYPLPTDFIALVQVGSLYWGPDLADFRGSSTAPFLLEGAYLLTDMGAPLRIRYVQRVTDPGRFDPAFAEALGKRLAMECCEKITGSTTKVQAAKDQYALAISEATRANALENPPESIADDTWVVGRLG